MADQYLGSIYVKQTCSRHYHIIQKLIQQVNQNSTINKVSTFYIKQQVHDDTSP